MTDKGHNSEQLRLLHPPLIALVATAVLLRIGLSFMLPRTIRWDEPEYLLAGFNLLTGNGFGYSGYPQLHFPPLYPVIAGLSYLLTGDFETASDLVYAISGGLLLFPVFAIARRIYGIETAWLAAGLIAVFPALTVNVLYWGTLTEPLYLLFLFAGLAVLLVGLEDDRLGMFSAAGALLGLAYLTRPEAVVCFGVFVIVAGVWSLASRKRGIRRTFYALLSFVLAFILLATPYIWYLHAHTGQWMISGKIAYVWQQVTTTVNYWDLLPDGEIAWLSPNRFHVNTLQSAFSHSGDILRRIMRNGHRFINHFFSVSNFWWGLTPLIVVTLFQEPWDRRRLRYEAFLMTIIVVVMVTFLPFFYVDRLFAPALPVLLIWTARGALYLGNWLDETVFLWRKKSHTQPYLKSLLRWLPASMVTGFLIVILPFVAHKWKVNTFFGDKEVGLWLKTHTPVDAIVMTKELGINLYANRRWVPLPRTDWAHFIQYAKDHHADYFVARNSSNLAHYWPDLALILQKAPPEIEPVFSYEEPHGLESAKTLVYRFSKLSDK